MQKSKLQVKSQNLEKTKSEEIETKPISFFIEKPLGGDWGKGKPDKEFSCEVYAIRGTDFPILKSGVKVGLPVRYIKKSSVEKRQLRAGDILIEISGGSQGQPVGRPFLITENMIKNTDKPLIYSNFCRRLRTKEKFDARYLYFQLLRIYHSPEIYSYQTQSTGISNFHFSDFIDHKEIPVFSPNEQKRIANILSAFDDKIELNNKIIKTLEEMAAAIFKEWFAVPSEALAKEGKLPRGWEVRKIGKVAKVVLGGTPSRSKPEYWGGNIPWINSGKTNEFRIISASEYITESGLKNSNAQLMPKRTTVIAITGATLGQVSLLEIEAAANQSVVGVFGSDVLSPEVIYLYIKNKIQEIIQNATGGAQQHINKGVVEDYPIIVPEEKIAVSFNKIISPIFDQISNLIFENKKLSSLRDLLLPKLMSGEVKV